MRPFLPRWIFGVAAFTGLTALSAASLLDPSFRLVAAIDSAIERVAVRPNGRILILTRSSDNQGSSFAKLTQLTPTGDLDGSFRPVSVPARPIVDTPLDVKLLPDGRILLAVGRTPFPLLDSQKGSRDILSSSTVYVVSADGSSVMNSESHPAFVSFTVLSDGTPIAWGTQYSVEGIGAYYEGYLSSPFDLSAIPLRVGNRGEINSVTQCRNGDLLVAGLLGPLSDEPTASASLVFRIGTNGVVKWSKDGAQLGALYGIGYAAEDPTGRIFVMGGGLPGVARFTAEGASEPESFDAPALPGMGPSLVLKDGRVVATGIFTEVSQVPRRRIVGLENDGTIDPRFDPGLGFETRADEPLIFRSIAEQPDGRILIAGAFTQFDGADVRGLVRLFPKNPDVAGDSTNLFYFTVLSGAAECGEPFQLKLVRAGDLRGAHEIRVISEGVTARPGVDFVPLQTNLLFGPGDRSKTLVMSMIPDEAREPDKTFDLRFESPGAPVAFAVTNVFRVRIANRDCLVRFQTNWVSFTEGELASWQRPSLQAIVPSQVAVRVRSRDLSAVAGQDYLGGDQLVEWPGYIKLQTFDNAVADGDRTFLIEFVDEGKGFTFGSPSNVVVTIRDNDTPLSAGQFINGEVTGIHPLPQRKWLLVGTFDRVNGLSRPGIARFASDGGFDPEFNPPSQLASLKCVYAVYPDGRMLAAGSFPSEWDPEGYGLIRLLPDGEIDSTFELTSATDPALNCPASPNRIVSITMGSDGTFAVAGRLPRFAECGKSSQVARFSTAETLTEQWRLPPEIGPVTRVEIENATTLLATCEAGVARLHSGGETTIIFSPSHPRWSGGVGPVVSLPNGETWIESFGILNRFARSGIWIASISNFFLGLEQIRAIQITSIRRFDDSHMLVAGSFSSSQASTLGHPQLLLLDQFSRAVAASRLSPNQPGVLLRDLAVNRDREIAAVTWQSMPPWIRFSRDLVPRSDLIIHAISASESAGVFLHLQGQAPHGYWMEVSEDLKEWRPWFHDDPQQTLTFPDPEPFSQVRPRYYRARF